MSKVKCHQCGLVNWQGATHCARCNGSLTAGSYSTGLNPFENEPKSQSGFGAGKIGVIAVILVVVGFAAYQFTKPEPPKKMTAAEKQQAVDSVEIQKAVQAAQQDLMEEGARLQESFNQTMEPTGFDKGLMEKSVKAPNTQRLPQIPPGQLGPPGRGTTIHTP